MAPNRSRISQAEAQRHILHLRAKWLAGAALQKWGRGGPMSMPLVPLNTEPPIVLHPPEIDSTLPAIQGPKDDPLEGANRVRVETDSSATIMVDLMSDGGLEVYGASLSMGKIVLGRALQGEPKRP